MKADLHRDRVTPIPKPEPKKKAKKKALSKRSKRKMDDGRKDLENECMDLWRLIVSHGKTVCEWCRRPHAVYQCHHIFSKGSSKALKYDPENGIYLGMGCHRAGHREKATQFNDFVKECLTPAVYQKLKLRSNNMVDHSLNGLKLIKKGLQQELDKLIKKNLGKY